MGSSRLCDAACKWDILNPAGRRLRPPALVSESAAVVVGGLGAVV